MGWNRVEHVGDLRLFEGIPSDARFYFVHSFYPVVAGTVSTTLTEGGLTQARVAPDARSDRFEMRVAPDVRPDRLGMPVAPDAWPVRIAWCQYGIRFAAAIEVGRIFATQFHPEKSQRWGLRMLENFAAIVKDGA